MSDEVALQNLVHELEERVRILEERVQKLEGTNIPAVSSSITVSSINTGELVEAIQRLLQESGEAEVTAIRQKLIKAGLECSKSDINKALYANLSLFKIARTDGLKPVWTLV